MLELLKELYWLGWMLAGIFFAGLLFGLAFPGPEDYEDQDVYA